MHYVISDIHGCLDKFEKLLKLIDFNENDILYVLGDCVDRGPHPIGVLKLMMQYDNIIPFIGNHEIMMMKVLPKLLKEVKEDNIEKTLTKEMMEIYFDWQFNGASTTIAEFRKEDKEMQDAILDYISDFTLYEKVIVKGRRYLLVHSLPDDYDGEPLSRYTMEQIVFGRFDYNKKFFDDTTIIVGHTPTIFIDPSYQGMIYKGENLYNIDCGAFGGYPLSCLCLENMQEYYIND